MRHADSRPKRDLVWHRESSDGAPMTSSTSVMGDTVVVQLQGRVDSEGLRDWVDVLESAAMLSGGPVLLDFARLESWTVTAQAVVVVVAHRLAEEGRLLAMCRLHPELTASGLLPRLESVMVYSDVDQATVGLRLPKGWWDVGVG